MSEKVDESVTFEQISDVTFEQIDELAKEIYVQLVKNGGDDTVSNAYNLSTQAYQLAEQWFVLKNERQKLYRNNLIKFYTNEDNRKNCKKWLNKSYTLNRKEHGEKLAFLKENSCYLVIQGSDNTNTPVVAFYYGESKETNPYYLFQELKLESTESNIFSIKAIFLEEI